MNAKSMAVDTTRYFRAIEPGIYALLSAALIAQLFLLEGYVTLSAAVGVIVGVVCGLMASCAAAPATALIQSLRESRPAPLTQTADVLSYIGRRPSGETQDDRRRAA